MATTKNREIKNIPKSVLDELNEVRKNYKNKSVWSNKTTNDYIRDCNAIIDELNSYKKELRENKNIKKYALNFDFPIRKKE